MLFEYVSIDNLLKPKTVTGWKSFLKEAAKQAGVEGSEELFTEVANILSDAAIMRGKSEVNLRKTAYEAAGLSRREAEKRTFLDCVNQAVWAAAGGVISGGVMVGGRVALDGIQQWGMETKQLPVVREVVETQKTAPMERTVDPNKQKDPQGMGHNAGTNTGLVINAEGKPPQGLSADSILSQGGEGIQGELTQNSRKYDGEMGLRQVEMLERTKESFGPSGQKAMMAAWEQGGDPAEYFAEFAAYYDAGVAGISQDRVKTPYAGTLTEAQRYVAYVSGQNDAATALAERKRKAEFASVAGKDSGLVYDDYVRENVDAKDFRRLNALLKALETRGYFVDTVGEGAADGAIAPGGSDILLSKDMEAPEVRVAGHELGHRIRDLAPEAHQRFQEAMTEALGEEELSIRL